MAPEPDFDLRCAFQRPFSSRLTLELVELYRSAICLIVTPSRRKASISLRWGDSLPHVFMKGLRLYTPLGMGVHENSRGEIGGVNNQTFVGFIERLHGLLKFLDAVQIAVIRVIP